MWKQKLTLVLFLFQAYYKEYVICVIFDISTLSLNITANVRYESLIWNKYFKKEYIDCQFASKKLCNFLWLESHTLISYSPFLPHIHSSSQTISPSPVPPLFSIPSSSHLHFLASSFPQGGAVSEAELCKGYLDLFWRG